MRRHAPRVARCAVRTGSAVPTLLAGAVGDRYAAWRIRGMPPGTLLYDSDMRHFYVFEPLDA